ncbi:MAG: hypothetical protein KF824_06840 [Fimbriimonadaceae bacterium]|nr:MAG: hypothetical protein KF824_06840 [Fimbriimonadaceae bacterium]
MLIHSPYPGNFVIPPAMAGKRAKGVPAGRPCDPVLGAIVQHLAENKTVIEITTPLTLQAETNTTITIASLPNSHVFPDHPTFCLGLIHVKAGESIFLHSPSAGLRAYVSWKYLIADSVLPKPLIANSNISEQYKATQILALDPRLIPLPSKAIRYIPTTEALSEDWKVTAKISRIGTRLQGQTPNLHSLQRSEPSIHGAIQVTPGDEILIHGPDGPTLGGYPKAGAVISADFDILAQLRPQANIQLMPVTFEEATALRKEKQRHLESTLNQITQVLHLNPFPRP